MKTKLHSMFAASALSALCGWLPMAAESADAPPPGAVNPLSPAQIAARLAAAMPARDETPQAPIAKVDWTGPGSARPNELSIGDNNAVHIARDIRDMLAGEPGLTVTQFGQRVLIEGDYINPATSLKLEAIFKLFPQAVVSTVPDHKVQAPVRIEKMVYLDVRVVEIHKNALEQLGVRWNSPIAGPSASLSGTLGHSWSTMFGIATSLTSMLDFLENNGDSWTLAEPQLSCKSGSDAKYVVGGEIPIAVSSGLGMSSVVYKEYGVIMEFHPVTDDEGNITSKIVVEVSEPDPTLSSQGLVAFRKNRTETQVSMRENETLVISGMLQNTGSRSVAGVPGVSELPVIGALFRSKQFQNDRTELIVLVTPRAASPHSETSTALAKRADEGFNKINSLIRANMAD
jgi:pilus assembly protein CpaC